MSYAEYLVGLLRPLGVYDWSEGTFQRAELAAFGQALDACAAELELVQREMLVSTAEDTGLTAVEALLPYRPVADSLARRRAALAWAKLSLWAASASGVPYLSASCVCSSR